MRALSLVVALALGACNNSTLSPANDLAPADLAAHGDLASRADLARADLSASGDLATQPGCVASGGTVSMSLCCGSVSDFPNSCLIGACSCAPGSSHMVQTCDCPAGHCFDGSHCVTGP